MTMGGNEAQPVRLIAVDSEGIPVTDPQILQAAAEQAGIQFVSKDENDEENSITIDQAMQLSQDHTQQHYEQDDQYQQGYDQQQQYEEHYEPQTPQGKRQFNGQQNQGQYPQVLLRFKSTT